MDEIERRICACCAECPWPFYGLHKDIGKPEDVFGTVASLRRLIEQGNLFARTRRDRRYPSFMTANKLDQVVKQRIFQPSGSSDAQIEHAILLNSPPLVFGMTEKGGALWEAFALPDWSRFIDVRDSCLDNKGEEFETHLWGSSRARLELALQSEYVGTPVADSQEWEAVSPWHATYWKTIPNGWHVRLRTRVDWSLYEGQRAAEMASFFSWF